MRPSSILSLGAVLVVFVLGVAYLMFGVVKVDWFRDYTTASMTLPNSGSLGPRSPVLLSGIKVGDVTDVRKTADGVRVDFRIDDTHHVPLASTVRIENLSTLGEPYVEFTPTQAGGPYLEDGQTVAAQSITAPLSIPQVARTVTTLLNQLDPTVIGNLIDTFDQALTGTETVIPRLARSTDLLAATLLSRTAAIRSTLIDMQNIATDIDWAGPSMQAAGPLWGDLGVKVDDIAQVLGRFARERNMPDDYTTGTGLYPFLQRLTAYIDDIGPDLKALEPTIAPLADAARENFPRIDLSALISQALNTAGDDGAIHLQINIK